MTTTTTMSDDAAMHKLLHIKGMIAYIEEANDTMNPFSVVKAAKMALSTSALILSAEVKTSNINADAHALKYVIEDITKRKLENMFDCVERIREFSEVTAPLGGLTLEFGLTAFAKEARDYLFWNEATMLAYIKDNNVFSTSVTHSNDPH